MIYSDFQGSFCYEMENVVFETAKKEDADEIAALYEEISIHSGNYQVRFDPDHKESFQRIGGMYKILKKQDILREIENPESLFAVAKKENGSITASFWFSKTDPYLSFYTPDPDKFRDHMEIYYSIIKAKDKGLLIFPRELIVSNQNPPPKIAFLMFYALFVLMQKKGYTHSLCEVYKLLSFEQGGRVKNIQMLNEKSYAMTSRTGGIHIDHSLPRQINLKDFSVKIESQIFFFDYQTILPRLKQFFDENNIKILWGGFE